MAWLKIDDYGSDGWAAGDFLWRSRHYCSELEKGQILFFPVPPFALPQDDIEFLVSLKPADSLLHKNISYRPEQDLLRGFADSASEPRVHDIMKCYATAVRNFVSSFLSPYAGKFQTDYASFRPLEEEGRNLPLHKRNDLLHVDAFPSRPTRGGRILRVFVNINPREARVWNVGEAFDAFLPRLAKSQKISPPYRGPVSRGVIRLAARIGLPVADRS